MMMPGLSHSSRIPAMYLWSYGRIGFSRTGARFFVPKIRWTRILESDCGMGYPKSNGVMGGGRGEISCVRLAIGRFVSPFQGDAIVFTMPSQGDALGWHVAALQADDRPAGPEISAGIIIWTTPAAKIGSALSAALRLKGRYNPARATPWELVRKIVPSP